MAERLRLDNAKRMEGDRLGELLAKVDRDTHHS